MLSDYKQPNIRREKRIQPLTKGSQIYVIIETNENWFGIYFYQKVINTGDLIYITKITVDQKSIETHTLRKLEGLDNHYIEVRERNDFDTHRRYRFHRKYMLSIYYWNTTAFSYQLIRQFLFNSAFTES